jgi:hypothetical protein
METLKQLQERIETELQKTDYSGKIVVTPSSESYSAGVNLQNTQMEFGFNLNHPELSYVRRMIAGDLPRHEYGHLGGKLRNGKKILGIPGDVKTSETHFFNPIYEVLSKKGFSKEDADYVENTLEDTLLHLEGSNEYLWNGITKFFKNQNFSEFYEAHVKLNMLLWGDSRQKNEIREKYTGSEKASKAIKNFLNRTNSFGNGLKSKEELRDYFLNSENWQEISKIYAEEFSSLMTPNYARPTINHNGAGTKGREKGNKSGQGNVFQIQKKTDEYLKDRVREYYDSGGKLPGWMVETNEDKIKSLDSLYDSLVDVLQVKAESNTIQESLPIATIVSKEFDPLTDSDNDTTIGINEFGRPVLYVPKRMIELPYQLKTGSVGFPKVKFVQLDSSDSMQEAIDSNGIGNTNIIPWGDNSKYHFSLLAWKGYLKYLILNGLLTDKNSVELDNFSTKTITGKGLDEAKRVAFMPQWKSTYINEKRAKEIFAGDGNLITSISDGEIANWDTVSPYFIEGAKRNYYFHFQIGQDSEACKDMRENNLHVESCRGHMDLAKRVIDLTRTIRRVN